MPSLRRFQFSVAALLLLAIVLPAAYMGAYYGIVVRQRMMMGNYMAGAFVSYRYGGSAAETFFWPAHKLDRKLRPEYWGE